MPDGRRRRRSGTTGAASGSDPEASVLQVNRAIPPNRNGDPRGNDDSNAVERDDRSKKTDTNGHSPNPQYATLGQEVQAFDSMRNLPIGLKMRVRKESCDLLNEILADTTILYALYKKHHWNVAGPTFYQLHLLFDKHAEEQLELIDLLAERVQAMGGISVGDPRHAAELTTIERAPDGAEDVPAQITRLLNAHETIIGKVRAGIETTETSKDWGSNDLLMGDVLRRHELQVWFIAEHLVDARLV